MKMDDQSNQVNESQDLAGVTTESESQLTGFELEQLSGVVAVRFLGHKWLRSNNDKYREGGLFLCSPKNLPRFSGDYVESDESDKNQHRSNDMYWADKPATDIAAAMEVVEHLRKKGYGVVMADNMGNTPLWNVDIVGELKIEGESHATTLPEAICRAALQAVKE